MPSPKKVMSAKPTGSGESEPDWVKNLRRDVTTIDKITLAELTLEQRVTLGQYHAYRFEHHSSSRAKCVNRGAKHIAAFAQLGGVEKFAHLTVAEYRGYMQRLMAASGALIRSPWAIQGALEDGE